MPRSYALSFCGCLYSAAVCKTGKNYCRNSGVKTATVIGFPFGYSAVQSKLAETEQAVIDGADELDVVINLIALKNVDWKYLEDEMKKNNNPSARKRKNNKSDY